MQACMDFSQRVTDMRSTCDVRSKKHTRDAHGVYFLLTSLKYLLSDDDNLVGDVGIKSYFEVV